MLCRKSGATIAQIQNAICWQRDACEAFIASQKHEGWELLLDRFDDGAISGGHMERPALKRLMKAIKEKRVDQVVVYKIDRLTRSLSDFAKIVDVLDAADTSFVSVPPPHVHTLVNLAMLSPEILALVASGNQPINLTTDYLLKTGFPIVWSDQRKMIEIS